MNVTPAPRRDKLWLFSVLPAVILNLGGLIIFGVTYGVAAQSGRPLTQSGQDRVQFILYVFIFVVEWVFAGALLVRQRRMGKPIRDMITPRGSPWTFRPYPALAVFIGFNALFAVYVAFYSFVLGGWPILRYLTAWQRLFVAIAVPVQAAFCEELIWRGYMIPELETRGWTTRSAVLLAAVSFALIHGVFLPDKLLVAFLLGIVAGFYFARERNLAPLMVSHLVVDVWSFALSLS